MSPRFCLIGLGLLLLVALNYGAHINTHIVGGLESDIENLPYQVSVRLDTYMLLHICGGCIYAPRVVLTAAHCIKGRFASYIRIVAGKNSITDLEEKGVKVTKLIFHSAYVKKTHVNDVGMIITTVPLVYSSLVQPIVLARDTPTVGTRAVVSGWGKRTETDEALPAMLRAVEVTIMDTNSCGVQYATKAYTITNEMICAGSEEGGKDACQGDSGGPLTVDDVLVGIVSWGEGCAREGFPGVYTSVMHHTAWIEEMAAPYL